MYKNGMKFNKGTDYSRSARAAPLVWKRHEEEISRHPEIPNEHAGRLRNVANILESRAGRQYGSGHDMAQLGEGKPHGK